MGYESRKREKCVLGYILEEDSGGTLKVFCPKEKVTLLVRSSEIKPVNMSTDASDVIDTVVEDLRRIGLSSRYARLAKSI